MTKRNVMISGEFTLSDMQQVSNTSNAAVTPTKKALERIEALKKAGIDTSSYYAINNDMVIRVEDGKPNLVGRRRPRMESYQGVRSRARPPFVPTLGSLADVPHAQ